MIRRADRHKIGAARSKQRIVELGDLEQQYARHAVEYYSSGLLFGGVTLECDNAFLKQQLPTALLVLQKQHPTLRCTLDKTPHGVYVYKENPEMEIPIDYRVRNGNPRAWHKVWEQEFETEHAKLGDPCLRVVVFTDHGNDTRHEIALVMNHFLCDGTSFSYLLHELLHNLGLCITPEDVEWGVWEQPWEDTKLLCEKYPRALPMYAGKYVKSIVDMGSVLAARDITALPFAPGHDGFQLFRTARQMVDSSSTHMSNHQLSKEETSRLLERCRAERCTVTSAVALAFAAGQQQAIQAWTGKQTTRVGSTLSVMVSMRNGKPTSPINLAPHISNIHMNVYHASDALPAELWHISRALYTDMQRFTEEDKLWNSKHTVGFMSTLPSGQNFVRLPNLAVSSWGSNAVQGSYGTTLRIHEGFFAQNQRQVSVPTLSLNNFVCGRLNIVLLAPTPRFDPVLLDDSFQRGMKNLQAMITTEKAKL